MLTKTTELQAVNVMLGTIGESRINSLEASSAVAESAIARDLLQEVLVEVLSKGWHFNTEYDFPLSPDTQTKEIRLPSNCIECDTSPSPHVDVAVRGNRLYNKKTHSYSFDSSLKVEMIVLLTFEELPQAAREYIKIRAARKFQKRFLGSDTLDGFTEEDERTAKALLEKYDARTADYNILSGSYDVARILNRESIA